MQIFCQLFLFIIRTRRIVVHNLRSNFVAASITQSGVLFKTVVINKNNFDDLEPVWSVFRSELKPNSPHGL